MIVKTEFLRFRNHPRPISYPLSLAGRWAYTETFDISQLPRIEKLLFVPIANEQVFLPDVWVEEENVPYAWRCESCLAGSGRYNEVFQTDWERLRDLAEGNPSPKQMDQIRDHARQQEIILTWARGVKENVPDRTK